MTPIMRGVSRLSEYLHLCNNYFLDTSFAEFFVQIDLTFKKISFIETRRTFSDRSVNFELGLE